MSKIGKIVELLIDWDEMEFEDLGVSIMSLVEKPAIGISWQAFADEQNFRENAECPDGFEHQMPDGSMMKDSDMEKGNNMKFAGIIAAGVIGLLLYTKGGLK